VERLKVQGAVPQRKQLGATQVNVWKKSEKKTHQVAFNRRGEMGMKKVINKSRRQASSHIAFRKKCQSEYATNSGCEHNFLHASLQGVSFLNSP
jgi:hypothetical protein